LEGKAGMSHCQRAVHWQMEPVVLRMVLMLEIGGFPIIKNCSAWSILQPWTEPL